MPADAQRPARNRQALTATTFVEIVDTLVNDYDVIDVLTQLTSRCVDLLEAAAAGILLADGNGHLRVIGASTEQIELLELFQVQNDQGPCLDCYNTGKVVLDSNLDADSRWPQFAAESVAAGFPSVYAVPLRLNDVVLGCLNLFMSEPVSLAAADIALAQALADVASIAIMQNQTTRHTAVRHGPLQHAINSRIAIEQAKGMIAEYEGISMHDAFLRLRTLAQTNNRGLTVAAEALVAGTITVEALAPDPLPPMTPVEPDRAFTTEKSSEHSVVRARGELDLATRAACLQACLATDHNVVVLDMSAVTFMDCSGYGGLIAARVALEQRGGSLTLRHTTDQPARLLALISHMEPST